jgi:endonuclease/exonuclease/phosphatase family metal-dependent hydrolase
MLWRMGKLGGAVLAATGAFLAFRPAGEFTPAAADTEGDGVEVKVLTWNILHAAREGSMDELWNRRQDAFRSVLADSDFDVVCLQEALPHQVEFFANIFPSYDCVTTGRDGAGSESENCPVFYRRDRFDPVTSGTFWLSPAPESPSKGWGEPVPRICTWVELRDQTSGRRFRVYNVHLQLHPYAQVRAAGLVARRAAECGLPAIVAGDFNAPPDWPALREFERRGFSEVERSGALTYHVAGKAIRCLDHILSGDEWSVTGGAILREKFGGVFPSDHFGLWAKLELAE